MRGCRCHACIDLTPIVCVECGKTVLVLDRKVRGRGQRFCSRTCANRWNAREARRTRPAPNRPLCACGCGKMIGKQAKLYRQGHNPQPRRVGLRGPSNPNWSGGPKRPVLSMEHRAWRERIFARDNWTCVLCGRRSREGDSVKLQAHHIVPVSVDATLAYVDSNGMTLCVECHRDHHWGVDRNRRLSESA